LESIEVAGAWLQHGAKERTLQFAQTNHAIESHGSAILVQCFPNNFAASFYDYVFRASPERGRELAISISIDGQSPG
jgi:hypothetical protein